MSNPQKLASSGPGKLGLYDPDDPIWSVRLNRLKSELRMHLAALRYSGYHDEEIAKAYATVADELTAVIERDQ